jgi:hypothetical protein
MDDDELEEMDAKITVRFYIINGVYVVALLFKKFKLHDTMLYVRCNKIKF